MSRTFGCVDCMCTTSQSPMFEHSSDNQLCTAVICKSCILNRLSDCTDFASFLCPACLEVGSFSNWLMCSDSNKHFLGLVGRHPAPKLDVEIVRKPMQQPMRCYRDFLETMGSEHFLHGDVVKCL